MQLTTINNDLVAQLVAHLAVNGNNAGMSVTQHCRHVRGMPTN
jgi:hypothetical protein